ncbi:hypothetical protein HBE96_21865 [Clostridium sp. P21]|uniref:HNH nuclease domain-containing protein n=1 Tax=Clostridium muellerianum TaxID=2716538 RepID=A0A7Y0HPN2_9CLOT|nr:hypothetical protein [Clostridium muellerianum]NMM65234.1 hypothetical protein [Clostridium muellerianum]
MSFIPKIENCIVYSKDEVDYINTLKPFEGKKWNIVNDKMTSLKKNIRIQLKSNQNGKCAYCGLSLERTSNSEIEHIAPKGKLRNGTVLHPEFMFTERNLAFACHYCNSILKKGTFDTIKLKNSNYEKCEFKIVHPYFDNPDEHYSWVNTKEAILIKAKSTEATLSISLFGLDTIEQSEARAEECSTRYLKAKLPEHYAKLLEEAMKFI